MALKGSDSGSVELNLIGKGTAIEGQIKTEHSIRIDGSVKGNISCKNTITIGEQGFVEGEVHAINAVVGGRIKGKIFVNEKLVLKSKSSLVGQLKAKKLIIDEGAVFEGTSEMGVNAATVRNTESVKDTAVKSEE